MLSIYNSAHLSLCNYFSFIVSLFAYYAVLFHVLFYDTEQYVKVITQKRYRSAYAKFRCGVAPIKLETCRYGLNRIPVDQRLCKSCNIVEDEYHVIMHCSLYDDICTQLFIEINNISDQFPMLSTDVEIYRLCLIHNTIEVRPGPCITF